jgi:hypothetical protein
MNVLYGRERNPWQEFKNGQAFLKGERFGSTAMPSMFRFRSGLGLLPLSKSCIAPKSAADKVKWSENFALHDNAFLKLVRRDLRLSIGSAVFKQPIGNLRLIDCIEGHERVVSRHGVITLFGYGISVRVDRGHLILEDGIGDARVQIRLPRVDHGLKRLVVIGSDGSISLSALRWLADQNASFVMLERDGSVTVTTGPVRSSDVRLRRAQALALENGIALRISRDLVDQKLAGQERVAMRDLANESVALSIRQFRADLAGAFTIDAVRLVEPANCFQAQLLCFVHADVQSPACLILQAHLVLESDSPFRLILYWKRVEFDTTGSFCETQRCCRSG